MLKKEALWISSVFLGAMNVKFLSNVFLSRHFTSYEFLNISKWLIYVILLWTLLPRFY